MNIPFNTPYLTGNEEKYLKQVLLKRKFSGNGEYTKACQVFLERKYNFRKVLLTTSATDALELAALLLDIKPGDEVILPSYTFVSTANAFALRGAKLIFADSRADQPNLDCETIEQLITPLTKVIVPVHYGGHPCDMEKIMYLAEKHHLWVVEDAAQAIDSSHGQRYLGGIGHLGAFSFHETKNINAGEGGALAINHPDFIARAEILWEKGTNRSAFFRGEVNKYGWVEVGSSFLPSELISAFLLAQLEKIEDIQSKRFAAWNAYHQALKPLRTLGIEIMTGQTHNAHLFYIVCRNVDERTLLLQHLKNLGIHAVFHYLSLHKSPYFADKHDGRELQNADRFTDCLLRLPMYAELGAETAQKIAEKILGFYGI